MPGHLDLQRDVGYHDKKEKLTQFANNTILFLKCTTLTYLSKIAMRYGTLFSKIVKVHTDK